MLSHQTILYYRMNGYVHTEGGTSRPGTFPPLSNLLSKRQVIVILLIQIGHLTATRCMRLNTVITILCGRNVRRQ